MPVTALQATPHNLLTALLVVCCWLHLNLRNGSNCTAGAYLDPKPCVPGLACVSLHQQTAQKDTLHKVMAEDFCNGNRLRSRRCYPVNVFPSLDHAKPLPRIVFRLRLMLQEGCEYVHGAPVGSCMPWLSTAACQPWQGVPMLLLDLMLQHATASPPCWAGTEAGPSKARWLPGRS